MSFKKEEEKDSFFFFPPCVWIGLIKRLHLIACYMYMYVRTALQKPHVITYPGNQRGQIRVFTSSHNQQNQKKKPPLNQFLDQLSIYI